MGIIMTTVRVRLALAGRSNLFGHGGAGRSAFTTEKHMSRKPDPSTMIARFKAGITGAGAKYSAGVAAVTDNPMAMAADTVDSGQWAAATAAAAPRMSANLRAVSLSDWKSAV